MGEPITQPSRAVTSVRASGAAQARFTLTIRVAGRPALDVQVCSLSCLFALDASDIAAFAFAEETNRALR